MKPRRMCLRPGCANLAGFRAAALCDACAKRIWKGGKR